MGQQLLSILPLLLFFLVLLFKPKKLCSAAAISLILGSVIALLVWQMNIDSYAGALLKGALVALDILFIMAGAILFLHVQRVMGYLDILIQGLSLLTSDLRTQVVIVAWFVGSFIEGIAGFGTTAVLVSPILIRLGLPINTAITVALLANTPAVVFGALGTPLRIGMQGVNLGPVVQAASLMGGALSLLVPVMLLWIVFWTKSKKSSYFWRALPQALLAGALFGGIYIATALLGNEFPTLLASGLGLLLFVVCLKLKLFLPQDGPVAQSVKLPKAWSLALIPFGFVFGLLLLAKWTLPEVAVHLPGQINYTLRYFNPGYILLLVSGVMLWQNPIIRRTMPQFWQTERWRFLKVSLTMCLMVALVQIWQASGLNALGIPSMAVFAVSAVQTPFWPIIAPLVGAAGAMIGGSATVSNLLLTDIQSLAATGLGLSVSTILALQVIGATGGNALAFTNLLAAQGACRVENREGLVFKRLIGWIALYLGISIGLGYWLL